MSIYAYGSNTRRKLFCTQFMHVGYARSTSVWDQKSGYTQANHYLHALYCMFSTYIIIMITDKLQFITSL